MDGDNVLLICTLGFHLECIYIGLMKINKKPLKLKSKWLTEEDYLYHIIVRTFQQLRGTQLSNTLLALERNYKLVIDRVISTSKAIVAQYRVEFCK